MLTVLAKQLVTTYPRILTLFLDIVMR